VGDNQLTGGEAVSYGKITRMFPVGHLAQPLIQVKNLSFKHPDDPAGSSILNDISVEIDAGEMVAVVGANGSGKTTFVRHLNALYKPTVGQVLINGMDTTQTRRLPAIRSLVGMVFQHPEDQMVAATVEEDVAFGLENLGYPSGEIRRRVEEALYSAGLYEMRKRPPHMLSAGQTQRAALAGVLATRPACIVFDEATAMLDPAGRRTVMDLMQRLHAEGKTIIYVTHFMEDVSRAERVLVLHHGRLVMDGSPAEIFASRNRLGQYGLEPPPAAMLADGLRRFIPGLADPLFSLPDLLAAIPPCAHATAGAIRKAEPGLDVPADDAWINVSHLGHVYLRNTPLAHTALADVSMRVGKGESIGMIGSTGSGKSTLMQHLNGLLRPQRGSVKVGPYDLGDDTLSLKTITRMVGLVFQNPDVQIFEQYVGDEIAYGLRSLMERDQLRERVRQAMHAVGLDFERDRDRLTQAMSGGERRKVALASVLAMQPEILILDEPTAGLDPASRRELRRQLIRLKEEGTTLVLSSHHMEDLSLLVERLVVLDHGVDVLHGTTGEVFAKKDLLEGYGLESPITAVVAARMLELGYSIPPGLHRQEDLENALTVCKEGQA